MKRVNVALIGCGAASQTFQIPAAQRTPEINVMALVDKNEALVGKVSSRFAIERYTTDYSDILDEIDAAIVTLPNHLHAEVSIEFLDQGIHVLCEKPMALNASECERMIKVNGSSSAQLMIGHQLRFALNWHLLKDFLEKERFGHIDMITFEAGGRPKSMTRSETNFYKDKKLAGGG